MQGRSFLFNLYALTLLVPLTSINADPLENTVTVKGNLIYYIHPNAGLIVLNSGLQVLRVVSLPGGAPNEVDADAITGTAFVACDGGVAVVPSSNPNVTWVEDTITWAGFAGNLIQVKQGFTDVAVCDKGGAAYFSHSNDASGMMYGYLGRIPIQGGPLTDVSMDPSWTAWRGYQELTADVNTNYLFAALDDAYFWMCDGSTGARIASDRTNSSYGDMWDFQLSTQNVNGTDYKTVEGSVFGTEGFNDQSTVLVIKSYDSSSLSPLIISGVLNPFGDARPLRYYRGIVYAGLVSSAEFQEQDGLAASKPGTGLQVFFSTGKPGDPVSLRLGYPQTLIASGNALFGSCSNGVIIVNAVKDQLPTLIAQSKTDGQGKLAEIQAGHVVGGAPGAGRSLNGSVPVYLIEASESGSIHKVDLSNYTLKLDSALPPLASYDGTTRIELKGENFTPDCKVFADLNYIARGISPNEALSIEAKNVTWGGSNTIYCDLPPLGLGPVDIVVTNNNGRQWASKNDALVISRPDLQIQSGDLLIVDTDSDPFDMYPATDEDGDEIEQPGAIYRFKTSTGKMDIITFGPLLSNPNDVVRNPVDGGYFVCVDELLKLGQSLLKGGWGAVFAFDATKGYLNLPNNLYATSADFLCPTQLVCTPNGRLFCLDATTVFDDPAGIKDIYGRVFEIAANGAVISHASSPYWNQPRTMDLGPDGNLYIGDPGYAMFGDPQDDPPPGIHRVSVDSSSPVVILRDDRVGFPLDADFGPDGNLYMVSYLFDEEVFTCDLDGNMIVSNGDLLQWNRYYDQNSRKGDLNNDGTTNGLDLFAFPSRWGGYSARTVISRVDVMAKPDPVIETLYDSVAPMPMCLTFDAQDNLLFIGATSTMNFNLYKFNPDDPLHPVFLNALPQLKAPIRIYRM